MKQAFATFSLAFGLVLAACSTSTAAVDDPPPATIVSPADTEDAPAATEQPPTTTTAPTDEPIPTEETVDGGPTEEVVVIDSSYRLEVITVPIGTTVTWVYNGGLPHTVTSDTNLFNSGTLGEGDTFSFTFEESGSFPYFCRFHGGAGGSGMSGVVDVAEG